MRLFSDRPDVLVPGRWLWCAPGALPVPFPHVFHSLGRLPREELDDDSLGEVLGSNVLCKAEVVNGPPGIVPCGSPDVWLNGALYADRGTPVDGPDGYPDCCKPFGGLTADLWAGGSAQGGKWAEGTRVAEKWQGGEAQGGAWADYTGSTDLWAGGQAEGGQLLDAASAVDRWAGGQREGGEFQDAAGELDRWTGGQREGGRALDAAGEADHWSGGEAEGGLFTASSGASDRWAGGEAEGGQLVDHGGGGVDLLASALITTAENYGPAGFGSLPTPDGIGFNLPAAGNVVIEWKCSVRANSGSGQLSAQVLVDGAAIPGGGVWTPHDLTYWACFVFQGRITGLGAGAHTVQLQVTCTGTINITFLDRLLTVESTP